MRSSRHLRRVYPTILRSLQASNRTILGRSAFSGIHIPLEKSTSQAKFFGRDHITSPLRFSSTSSTPTAPSGQPTSDPDARQPEPAYELTFTCKPCMERSTHRISKHGYHKGTVLITCPNCKNRHVISDHLKIFGEEERGFEDILKSKGLSMKRGTLEGDMEFWDDGTTTDRQAKE